jgi:hypothetical protein
MTITLFIRTLLQAGMTLPEIAAAFETSKSSFLPALHSTKSSNSLRSHSQPSPSLRDPVPRRHDTQSSLPNNGYLNTYPLPHRKRCTTLPHFPRRTDTTSTSQPTT